MLLFCSISRWAIFRALVLTDSPLACCACAAALTWMLAGLQEAMQCERLQARCGKVTSLGYAVVSGLLRRSSSVPSSVGNSHPLCLTQSSVLAGAGQSYEEWLRELWFLSVEAVHHVHCVWWLSLQLSVYVKACSASASGVHLCAYFKHDTVQVFI